MALEDLTGSKYIDSLVATNPATGDNVSEGDDHIRGIKNVLKNTFPNVNGAVSKTDEDLNNAISQTSSTGSMLLNCSAIKARCSSSKTRSMIATARSTRDNCGAVSTASKIHSPPTWLIIVAWMR